VFILLCQKNLKNNYTRRKKTKNHYHHKCKGIEEYDDKEIDNKKIRLILKDHKNNNTEKKDNHNIKIAVVDALPFIETITYNKNAFQTNIKHFLKVLEEEVRIFVGLEAQKK